LYNFLVTSSVGAWDKNYYVFERSRFLEYTNSDVETKYKELTESSLERLKSYPCLFAYERDAEDIKIGYLTNISKRGTSKLFIEFEIDASFSGIGYEDLDSIKDVLDIRDWEINRTHWALKDEDLFARLIEAQLIGEELVNPIKSPRPSLHVSTPRQLGPPIRTLKGFIDKILNTNENVNSEIFYRGHSKSGGYKLEPSVFRKDKKGNYLYLDKEDILYRELMISQSSEFEADSFTLDKLVRMQHFSLPTRLLDITSNPLIALYFACKSYPDEVGEVITFAIKKADIRYYDSDVASLISNFARLPKSEKAQINFNLPKDEFNKQESVVRLLHLVKDEKPYFLDKILPEDLSKIVCVKSKRSNGRISSQSGAFLLFGNDAILNEQGTEDIQIIRTRIGNKKHIIQELDTLNINESTVFPNIESSALYIKEKFAFKESL
jgi:hypothetical protein